MDLGILHWIQETVNHPMLIQLFRIITALGDGGIIWILYALVLLVKTKKKQAFFLIATLILTALVVNVALKQLILRPRPFVSDLTLIPRITPPTSASFPSGHSATSLCCAAFLFASEKNWMGKSALLLGILIALSRLILLVHYPTDVLFGSIIGAGIGLLMHWIMQNKSATSA